MVFDPRFLGFDHGIENGEQFAHGCDEGDLLRFAQRTQVPVKLADRRFVPGGGQGGHVQGRAHLCTASPTHYVGPRCAGLGTGHCRG